jgi:hypothetical protein
MRVPVTLADKIEARLRAMPAVRRAVGGSLLRWIALEAADAAREHDDEKHQRSVWCGLHGVWDCPECERT